MSKGSILPHMSQFAGPAAVWWLVMVSGKGQTRTREGWATFELSLHLGALGFVPSLLPTPINLNNACSICTLKVFTSNSQVQLLLCFTRCQSTLQRDQHHASLCISLHIMNRFGFFFFNLDILQFLKVLKLFLIVSPNNYHCLLIIRLNCSLIMQVWHQHDPHQSSLY